MTLKRNGLVIRDYISDIRRSSQCITMSEPNIQDLESCNELITELITLRLVLKDTEKTKMVLKLEKK